MPRARVTAGSRNRPGSSPGVWARLPTGPRRCPARRAPTAAAPSNPPRARLGSQGLSPGGPRAADRRGRSGHAQRRGGSPGPGRGPGTGPLGLRAPPPHAVAGTRRGAHARAAAPRGGQLRPASGCKRRGGPRVGAHVGGLPGREVGDPGSPRRLLRALASCGSVHPRTGARPVTRAPAPRAQTCGSARFPGVPHLLPPTPRRWPGLQVRGALPPPSSLLPSPARSCADQGPPPRLGAPRPGPAGARALAGTWSLPALAPSPSPSEGASPSWTVVKGDGSRPHPSARTQGAPRLPSQLARAPSLRLRCALCARGAHPTARPEQVSLSLSAQAAGRATPGTRAMTLNHPVALTSCGGLLLRGRLSKYF